MRRTPGCRVSAAPTSSPIPCTTLKTPGGKPASATRSQRSEHESGDHSAGLRTTVQPAASAGAVFQVESMNGAFQGVITTAGPLGIRMTRFARAVRLPDALLVRHREIGVGAEVPRAARDHARAERAERASPCRGTRPRRAARRSRRSGRRAGAGARRGPAAPSAAHAGNASVAAATARSASRSPPRATSASGCASIGREVGEASRRSRRARRR